jgi:hypothetical protein
MTSPKNWLSLLIAIFVSAASRDYSLKPVRFRSPTTRRAAGSTANQKIKQGFPILNFTMTKRGSLMGDHSERLKARNNGKAPYSIDSADEFQRQLYTLLDRLGGDVSLYSVIAALARAEHVVQLQIDSILERAHQEQEGDQDEDGKAARTGPEYPH